MPVPCFASPSSKPVSTSAATSKENVENIRSQLAGTGIVDSTPSTKANTELSSPSNSENFSLSSNGSIGSDEDATLLKDVKTIVKTAHKIAEESGQHQEEPLLKENPHRFVLFPIQDNDVSAVSY